MKNDNHKWDNRHPTAQMLGRWQPWHDGHQKLFEETLKKTGQVNIMVRDVKGVDDNPFDFETVKKNILEALKDYKNRIQVTLVPNITNICYGRGVGYKIEEILKKTGQVNIMVRDVKGVDDNPFDFETVKKNIFEALKDYKNTIQVNLVPNITNICYGRGVGYKIEEIVLDEKTQQISATKIREQMRKEGKLK